MFNRQLGTDQCFLEPSVSNNIADGVTFQRVDPDDCTDLAIAPVTREVRINIAHDVLGGTFGMELLVGVSDPNIGGDVGAVALPLYAAAAEAGTATPDTWIDNELTGQGYSPGVTDSPELSSGGRFKVEVFPWKD